MTESATALRVVEETPAYWRVVFDYPPFVDATIFEGLQDLLARMDASQASGSWYSKAQVLNSILRILI